MASTPESASRFQKTVCLHDWWLVTAENDFNERRLAVAGLTSKPEEPVRIFSSAPIVKRYDVFTLETDDGFCVVIKGFINKKRTTDNGFSDEVFKHFVFGFPPNWEAYATNCFEGKAFDVAATGNISDTDKLTDRSKSEGKEKVNVTPNNFGRKISDRLRNLKNIQNSSLFKNLDAKWTKKKEITFGSITERNTIDSAPACSDCVENISHIGRCDSRGEISNLCDGELSSPMHGDLMKKHDGRAEDGNCCSPKENNVRQESNRVDAVAQDVMQSMNVTKTVAASFTGLVGSHHKTDIDVHVEDGKSDRKEEKASLKKAKRKILFDAPGIPITGQGMEMNPIISPECLGYGRSRSGRLLLPPMEFWRNQLPVYDVDRTITGIQQPMRESPRGSKTEPRRKR